MRRFRESLQHQLCEKVTIIRGHPTSKMVDYQEWVVSLMSKTSRQAEAKALTLKQLANRDWARSDQVQVFLPRDRVLTSRRRSSGWLQAS